MSRPLSAAGAAFVAIPLLAAAVIMPSGLDTAVAPLAACGIPLAWAAFVAIALGLDPMGLGVAGLVAMPFSAYASAAFESKPSAIALAALCASYASAVAVYRTAYGATSRSRPQPGGTGRLRAAAAIAAGSAPGIALVSLAGPTTGAVAAMAASALITASALYMRRRSER